MLPASIQNGLFLGHVGFDAAPFVPKRSFGRAKREQPPWLLANRRRFLTLGLRIGCEVRRGEGGQPNRSGTATALTIEFCKNFVDAEKRCGRSIRCPLRARHEIGGSVCND